jgi:hypothetical protein
MLGRARAACSESVLGPFAGPAGATCPPTRLACLALGRAQESTLEIEYVPAVVPPQPRSSTPHDDWCGLRSRGSTSQAALLPAHSQSPYSPPQRLQESPAPTKGRNMADCEARSVSKAVARTSCARTGPSRVSAVDASRASAAASASTSAPGSSPEGLMGVLVSGSYDGLLRLWSGEVGTCPSAFGCLAKRRTRVSVATQCMRATTATLPQRSTQSVALADVPCACLPGDASPVAGSLECVASASAHAGGVNAVRFLPRSQVETWRGVGRVGRNSIRQGQIDVFLDSTCANPSRGAGAVFGLHLVPCTLLTGEDSGGCAEVRQAA